VQQFGFFHVGPSGVPQSVIEFPGAGPGAMLDPFVTRLPSRPRATPSS
jgi:hypothetical protein